MATHYTEEANFTYPYRRIGIGNCGACYFVNEGQMHTCKDKRFGLSSQATRLLTWAAEVRKQETSANPKSADIFKPYTVTE